MEDISGIDFSAVDEIVGRVNAGGYSFSDYVGMIVSDGGGVNYRTIADNIFNTLRFELSDVKTLLAEMIFIVIVAAVYVNISRTFRSRQVSETGFYITYMFLFMLLAVSFGKLYEMAEQTMGVLLSYMQALVPAFFLTVSYVSGGAASVTFYQEALILITLVEAVLLKIFLPLINVYFVFALVNPLLEEDLFSNMLELLDKLISWGIKSMFAVVAGIGAIQSLIIPVAGNIRNGVVIKRASSIPGVGGSVSAVMESVLGAGAIIKNAVGAAGLIAIVIICAYPVLKLMTYAVLYHAGAAFSQPVAGDKRMPSCMVAASRAARLMLMVVGMSAVLFMLTIAVVTLATGRGY
ncbi:MAG: hypothetical protein HFH14_02565 [Lachnospiraceae bacterium]|nr:hypothetical protein [Lachnospiraceae bacterium]